MNATTNEMQEADVCYRICRTCGRPLLVKEDQEPRWVSETMFRVPMLMSFECPDNPGKKEEYSVTGYIFVTASEWQRLCEGLEPP